MPLVPRGRRAWLRALALPAAAGVATVLSLGFMTRMPGRSHTGPLPPLTAEEASLRARLEAHVRRLSGEIGERNVWRHDALEAAARHLEQALRAAGLEPRRQSFEAGGGTVSNLEAEVKGSRRPDEVVVVGAHYDSVEGCPGADDNATGTAALLEIAAAQARSGPERTLRFVAFVNEEPPFFQTDAMGSLVHARRCRARGEKVVAMLSLETLGFYSDAPGSQRYPFPLDLLYPPTGDFLAFVSNPASRSLLHEAIASFRRHTPFPSQGAAAPSFLPGIGWSDHWAFWQQGYPAMMVTDTALFRNPHYHERHDQPDTIDYERLARVSAGLSRVVAGLARARP